MSVHDSGSSNEDAGASRSLLDEIVRDGAQQMLAAALAAEVAAYVDEFSDQVDEHGRAFGGPQWPSPPARRADRRGGGQRAGAAGQRPPCRPPILMSASGFPRRPCRRGPQVPQMTEVLQLLYLHGLSSGDFGPALGAVPGFGCGVVGHDDHPH